jgi:DNA repair protein RadC
VAKAASIKAISEIALRSQTQQSTLGIKVKKPADLFSIVRKDLFDKPKEYLCMVCLNTKGVCVAKTIISIGTLTETLVDQREIFKTALEKNAASIALAHNHPSGDITPSENDIKVTQKVAQAGDEIGIPVVDHLIVYNDTFLSMKSKGLLKDFITQ